jgi:type IV secretion system protein VirD4
MTEKKQQHKKKRGKVQHIRGSPKKRKISGKAVFSSESIPGKMLADVKNLITDKVSELKRADQKKLFLANFPYLMFAYFFNKIAWLYRVNTGATSWDKFMNTITYFELAFQNLWPSLNHIDLLCGIAGGCKAYYYLPHEKCQEISAGCGVWFCQMGNRKRYTTIC